MSYRIGRRMISSLLILLAVLSITATVDGCAPTREEQIKSRLENFKTILPEKTRADFENEKYDDVVLQIDSLLVADPVFAARWNEMKSAEAINLFTTAEVIDYFVTYFVSYQERR
jgi:hypothetical protein